MEFTDIRAPAPVSGVPPWQDAGWVAEADAWIAAECARAGLTRAGEAQGRCRSYSVVARVPVADGNVWFKASPPASRFEPALLAALARWFPGRFAVPVAVDLGRAWSLTRDGGPTLRQQGMLPGDLGPWEGMLRGYGRLQFELADHVGELLALGLGDLRPASVPREFERFLASPATERAVGAPDGIDRGHYQALRRAAPRLREWCAELADLGIPASLDHADVHPNNVFATAGMPFDWGDATVAHPFCSLSVALQTAAGHAGLPLQSPGLAALAGVYVRPWLEAGYPRAVIDRSVSLALRIAPLGRALAWGKVFPCYLGHSGPAGHAVRALAAVLQPGPLDPGHD